MTFFNTIWKKYFAAGLLLFIPAIKNVNAQNNSSFRHLTSADGLTSNNIGKIIQDSRGFLWIGTEDGLNMYDGQTIKQYYLSDYIALQANSNVINGIAEDVDHNILIAAKAGIIKFSWNTKQFSVVYKNSFPSFGNVNTNLFVDAMKNIWVNERVRIKKFDPHFHLLHTWNLRDSLNSKNLNGPSITFICGEDTHHNVWFTDSTLVFRIDAATNKIDSSENQKLKFLNADYRGSIMMCFSGSSVWMIENEHTLLHLNSSFQLIKSYELSKQITPFYTGIIEQNEKTWIATRFNGILILDIRTGQIQQYGENNTLTSDNITNITNDASGNIWISTFAGINEFRVNASFFHQLIFDISNNTIAQPATVQRIFFKNNTLFTFISYGIIQTRLSNNQSRYFFDSAKKNSGGVYYSAAFPFQEKWLLSRYHDIEFLQFKNHHPVFSSFVLSRPVKLDYGIVSFYQDRDKNIWIGLVNDGGIACWNTGNDSFVMYSQRDTGKHYCPLRHFSCAAEDDDGNIWMGYDKGGISVFDKTQNLFVQIPSIENKAITNASVSGMVNDHHGNLWIATNTGLIQYDETKNTYKLITRKDGLPSNFVKSITSDDAGNIWTGFEGALAEIIVSANTIKTYNTTDGLPGADLENPLYDSASATMFFCTDRSVVYFNPQQVIKIIPALRPVITSFQVMGKEQPVAANKELSIPYSENYLSYSFSAPNFINASETEYACKLDGADKNWNYIGNHHFASYSQLQPGNYTFRVMARVKGGEWREAAEPVTISILTPFWRTLWFWALCSVLFLIIIFVFVYIRVRNKFEKQILAQSIRDKIAGDLHDDIGSTLSSISILSELAKQKSPEAAPLLEHISKNTSLMQENMSDIVWAINPQNDRFGNIIQRMSQFAVELLEPKNIDVNFNSDESLVAFLLPMEKRKNFYLLFKEAINNCAKYSGASHVDILISTNDHHINLIIADNGKGFDASGHHEGNGMTTMKKRASELRGNLQINSVENKGTVITLNFKI